MEAVRATHNAFVAVVLTNPVAVASVATLVLSAAFLQLADATVAHLGSVAEVQEKLAAPETLVFVYATLFP